ncbi:M1 family metallopeptidase [Pedobacter nyackensis]|uniref:Peptidase M1 membrane alanine aminopeptidase domain-containing protein n=1 Tax=Pedobacter nyackensis TaxID=475255 RepID=A0A1W2ABV3_9SPHI|nr:M1 family metallopeptidase [Pedobacter nyackensis]SMC57962.1 hypothetical protein SAMN04488101_101425 [Pedobacter nyackensis]
MVQREKISITLCLWVVAMAFFIQPLYAQQPVLFDPHETFKSMSYPPDDLYRTANGRPGVGYWQNKADYKIVGSFDTLSRVFSAKMIVTYTNNSPHDLHEIWIGLAQNRFRKDSRASALTPINGSRFGIQEYTEGFVFDRVSVPGKSRSQLAKAAYELMNDQLKIDLPNTLKPSKSVTLSLNYHFTLPVKGSDFMGVMPSLNGSIYQISSWFPRVVVYDNIKGWNTNAGYYVEPGKLDYSINVPSEMIVQGTGSLVNPREVLTKLQYDRLMTAAKSDTTVQIRRPEEINLSTAKSPGSRSIWHFKADNAGDAIFAISKAFIWDAVKVNIPGKAPALAMSLYPMESNFAVWQESAQSMKKILENYSKLWGAYPYATAVNIGGLVTGIAGPGACFLYYKSNGMANGVWPILNHELGHNWFNIMVAGNGRHGWMVEGLNSFINHVNGEQLKRQTAFEMPDAVQWLTKAKPGQTAATPAELVTYNNFALLSYMKPAIAINLLRTQVLGAERFDPAFRGFIADWKFKHPMPSDFFRYMESATGEDLSWFWQSWFMNDWRLDQSLTEVAYVDNRSEKGINIKLLNKGKMVMPVVVEVIEFNGNINRVKLPAEIWQKGPEWVFHYPSTTTVISVKIDPDQRLPDQDYSNNTWQGNSVRKSVPAGVTAKKIVEQYLHAVGGRNKAMKVFTADLEYFKLVDEVEYVLIRTVNEGQYDTEIRLSSLPYPLHKYTTKESDVRYRQMGTQMELNTTQKKSIQQMCQLFPELQLLESDMQLEETIQNINGTDVYVLHLDRGKPGERKCYYEVSSGLKVKEVYLGAEDFNLLYSSLDIAEYKPVNGLLLPHTLILKRAGENIVMLKKKQFKLTIN